MPLIWNLKLPARQRMAVMSIFGLGIIVNVAGAIRTAFVYESMIATYDATWMGWPILLSAAIEINLGLVCSLMLWVRSHNILTWSFRSVPPHQP